MPPGAKKLGLSVGQQPFFDTVRVEVSDALLIAKKAVDEGVNLRVLDDKTLSISLCETTTLEDVDQLLRILNSGSNPGFTAESLADKVAPLHLALSRQDERSRTSQKGRQMHL